LFTVPVNNSCVPTACLMKGRGHYKDVPLPFLYKENHSLGEWFKRRLMPMMQKEKLLLL